MRKNSESLNKSRSVFSAQQDLWGGKTLGWYFMKSLIFFSLSQKVCKNCLPNYRLALV